MSKDEIPSGEAEYPTLPADEQAWRPQTCNDILLRDRDLAKLGFLAQAEAMSKNNVIGAIKGAEGLTTSEWRKLETQQFKQLINRLEARAAVIDPELETLVAKVKSEYESALTFRHKNLHSLWAWNAETSGPAALDMKRNEKLLPDDLQAALENVASLTFSTKACLYRVGKLIADGTLVASSDQGGPHICVGDGAWVKI